VIAQLEQGGKVTRGWIGVQIQQVTPDIAESLGLKNAEGALVAEPQAESPAAKAGIQSGDVITAVDGQPVKNARELARKISSMAPGTSVKLGVWRTGAEKALTLTRGELPDRESLGLKNAEGALVAEPQAESPAAKAGIQSGDVITAVDGQPVKNARELARKISSMAPGTSVKLGVWRTGAEKALTLTLGEL